jgi:hypothetical protein
MKMWKYEDDLNQTDENVKFDTEMFLRPIERQSESVLDHKYQD